jgi:hypothetical protein
MRLTLRRRIRDAKAGKRLDAMAVAVNQVFTYCGGGQNDSRRLGRRWPSGYDLIGLTNGSSKDLLTDIPGL